MNTWNNPWVFLFFWYNTVWSSPNCFPNKKCTLLQVKRIVISLCVKPPKSPWGGMGVGKGLANYVETSSWGSNPLAVSMAVGRCSTATMFLSLWNTVAISISLSLIFVPHGTKTLQDSPMDPLNLFLMLLVWGVFRFVCVCVPEEIRRGCQILRTGGIWQL